MDQAKIAEALDKLDPGKDAHWTKGGAPDLNTMRELAGAYVSREACNAARPGFNREAAAKKGLGDGTQEAAQAEQGAATPEGTGAETEPAAQAPEDAPPATTTTPANPSRGKRGGFRHNWK